MGAVFSAHDVVLGRDVALKQLQLSAAQASKRKLIEALFEREYHTLVRLKHPRIVQAYEYGLDTQGPYYTMELLGGRDLKELAPLPYREVCQHLRDVASGLALLHAHGLVHRDVSPRNVRLGPDGRAKLIDFGALAPFGVATSIVGTPICIAPELLRRMPLDQRSDLFGLGAIAYIALTGELPYSVRRLEDLPGAWHTAPLPPSQRVPGVPAALDALVLSLLKVDPLARPSSAAAVIDQLTAIGELPAEEHDHAAASYLRSSALVGREHERSWLLKRVARALTGSGAQVVASGGAGIGKTRLLHELSLEAQLKGMVAVKADAQASPEAFGVATRLGVELLMAIPEQAQRAARPYAGLLVQLSDALRERLGDAPPVALATDPSERRARFQSALHDWFVQTSKECPLWIAVDNAQAADSNSAAFLAAIGRASEQNRMLLLATQRTGETRTAASDSLRALRKQASHLKLGALGRPDCEQLVGSLFGDVPNTGRIARLLHERSGGNPQHCIELAQVLVRKRIATYVAGTWVLPLDIDAGELPDRLDELVAERLAAVGDVARDLVETLSVDGAPVSIDRCLTLANRASAADVYQALAELIAEQILVVENDSYRFAQPRLREAVLLQMDEARRRSRHLQIAHEMLAQGPKHGRLVAAALHLVRAGEEGRGADIIAQAGRAYLRDTDAYDSSELVVRALQKALEIYDRQGRSKYQMLAVLYPLITLGFFVDWRIVRDHSMRGLSIGLEITGLARAHALSRRIGVRAALVLSLSAAALEFRGQKRRGLDYGLKDAIRALCAMVPGTVGTNSIFFDLPAIQRVQRMLEPVGMLGKPDQVPKLLYRFVEIQPLVIQGRVREAAEALGALAPAFMTPRMIKDIGEGQCRGMYGGVIYIAAIEHCYCFGRRALELADEMERLGIHTWAASAEQVRLLYHAVRGESEAVARCRARVELFAVQGESMWQVEIFLPALLLDTNLLVRDTVAARRNAEQLARRAEQVESLVPYARLAHAGYLGLRGDLPAAIAAFEDTLPRFPPHSYPSWLLVRAFFADVLNRAGQHARAKQLLLEALSCSRPEDAVAIMLHLEPRRQLALAEAGLGNHARAVELLDAMLAEHGHQDNRLAVGLMHEARAEVALQMRDEATLHAHFAQMEERFRATKNPALIAQVERLAARAQLRHPGAADPSLRPAEPESVSIQRSFAEIASAPDRYKHALQLVLRRTRAKNGFLYVLRNRAAHLVAASSPDEPPLGLEAELLESALRLQNEENDADETRMLEPEAPGGGDYQVIMLATHRDRRPIVVGGLILEDSESAWLDAAFLESIAQALHDREGLSTAF